MVRKCFYCGKGPHPKQSCPAKEVICHKCKKKGHYSSVCCNKVVDTFSEEQDSGNDESGNDDFWTPSMRQGTSWTAPIKINRQEIVFKLDTGAEATAVSITVLYNSHPKKNHMLLIQLCIFQWCPKYN